MQWIEMFSSSVDLLQASVLRPENIHTLNNHNAVDTQLGWWQEIIIKKKKKHYEVYRGYISWKPHLHLVVW